MKVRETRLKKTAEQRMVFENLEVDSLLKAYPRDTFPIHAEKRCAINSIETLKILKVEYFAAHRERKARRTHLT